MRVLYFALKAQSVLQGISATLKYYPHTFLPKRGGGGGGGPPPPPPPPKNINLSDIPPPLFEMHSCLKKERLIFLKKENILFQTLNKNTFEC